MTAKHSTVITLFLSSLLFAVAGFADVSSCEVLYGSKNVSPYAGRIPKKDSYSLYKPEFSLSVAAKILDFLPGEIFAVLSKANTVYGNDLFLSFEFKSRFLRSAHWWIIGEFKDSVEFSVSISERGFDSEHPSRNSRYHYPSNTPFPKYSVDLEIYNTNPRLIRKFMELVNQSELSPELKERAAKTIGADISANNGRFPMFFHEDAAVPIILSIIDQLTKTH